MDTGGGQIYLQSEIEGVKCPMKIPCRAWRLGRELSYYYLPTAKVRDATPFAGMLEASVEKFWNVTWLDAMNCV